MCQAGYVRSACMAQAYAPLLHPAAQGPPSAESPSAELGAYASPGGRRARYLQRVLDASFNVLFDARRRTVHTLALNYFVVSDTACLHWRRPLGGQQA